MQKVTLFHATTKENYLSIMENGFNPELTGGMVWNCSSDQEMYFYDIRKTDSFDGSMFEDADYTKEDIEEMLEDSENECIRNAFDNGVIAAAVQESNHDEIYCFKIEISKDLVEDDTSCDGMADVASSVPIEDLSIDLIKAVYVCDTLYKPSMRLFCLAAVYGRDHLNDIELDFSEVQAIKFLQENGYFNEDSECDYRQIL